MSDYIFDFSNPKIQVKGALSAVLDNENCIKELQCPFNIPAGIVEVIAFIWVDEHGDWIWRMRLKFPSGNKHAFGLNMGKDANETKCLQEMYRLPMKEKHWFRNPTGRFEDMIEIMRKNDLIASIQVQVNE